MKNRFNRPRGQKFNATKVFQHGRYWASRLELAVYEMLLMMERGGKLTDIRCQVRVKFHTYEDGIITMIPDFTALDLKTNETIFIEAKGFPTREWVRKKKAWHRAQNDINGNPLGKLYVYAGNWRYPKLSEIIEPLGGTNGR